LKVITGRKTVAEITAATAHAYKRSDSSDWSGGFKCGGGGIVKAYELEIPKPKKRYTSTHSGCFTKPPSPTEAFQPITRESTTRPM